MPPQIQIQNQFTTEFGSHNYLKLISDKNIDSDLIEIKKITNKDEQPIDEARQEK